MPANAMDYSNTEVPVYKASSNVSIARCMAAWMQGGPMEAEGWRLKAEGWKLKDGG
jgi:hypothetical protein